MPSFTCTNVETGEEVDLPFHLVESAEFDDDETYAYLHVGEETYLFEIRDDYDKYCVQEIIEPN